MASPKRGWSPHSAALKRRQRKSSADASKILGALGNLDIDDNDDEIDYLKIALDKDKGKPLRRGKRKDKSKSPAKKRSVSPTDALRLNKKLIEEQGDDIIAQEDIPPAIAEKLAIIADPESNMRDRIALEVEMRKNPEEEPYLAKFRDKFDRKKFLKAKEAKDKEEEKQMEKFFTEEEIRHQKEEEERARAKQAELDAIREAEEREQRMKEEVRLHRARVLAEGSEEARKNAEKMLIGVTEKLALNEMEEKEREARIEEFMETEGKHLTHVEKELARALLEQKSTRTDLG